MSNLSSSPPAEPFPVWGVLYQSWPNPDGTVRLEYLTAGAEDLLEMSADDLATGLQSQTLPVRHPDPAAFYRSIVESAVNHTPWSAEFEFVTPRTGRHLWLRAQDFPRHTPDGVPYFSGVLLDVTREKETERKLSRAFQTLTSHLDNTPLGVIEWNAEGRVIRWTPQSERIFGWAADEVLGKAPNEWAFLPPGEWERVADAWAKLASGEHPRGVMRTTNLHKAGHPVLCEWHNSLLTDDAGRVVSVLSLVHDVTEEVRAKDAAARSEKRLQTALQYAGMLGWDYHFAARDVYYSADVGEYYGVPELVGFREPDSEVLTVFPDDRPRVLAAFADAIRRCGEAVIEFRGAGPGADGKPRWFVTRARVFAGPDGSPAQIVGVTTDVTARKRAEEERAALERELQEARKRESLGLLAGGIAHDFNNLLTVILGNADVVRGAFPPDAAPNRSLKEIEAACHRAADLCRQIAAFAGTGRFVLEHLDLSAVVRDAELLVTASVRPGVAVHFDLGPGLPVVYADLLQVRQLVLNLVLNGSDAAPPAGGWVRVRTTAADLTPEAAAGFVPPLAAGPHAVVEVTDNGHGMDDATRLRVFDPFFTTKATGRGLGLAAVHGIVRGHDAGVRIASEPGGGTTVRVYFPGRPPDAPVQPSVARSGSVPPAAPRSVPLPTFGPRESGTVLVVDDEPNVRELAASLLEEVGYAVVAAGDGFEGLAAVRADPGRFRLALIDMLMPGMTGEELLRGMRAVRADLPVVVMTGFTNKQLPDDLAGQPGTALVVKPFRLERLLQIVRETIAAAEK
jgi:PAS domain S-box-containing protein